MWRGEPEWSQDDTVLAYAATLYQRMICPHCGYPRQVCHDPAAVFDAVEETCQARAAVDRHQEHRTGKPEPGVVVVPVLDDSPSQYGGPPPGFFD